MNGNFDVNKLKSQIIKASGGKISRQALDKASSGNIAELFSSLGEKEKAALSRALSNKDAAQKILNSSDAKNIMNNFKKSNSDG